MEKQYIEKKEVVAIVNELPRVWDKKCGISRLEYLKIRINNILPAADAVEVVRCGECKHWETEWSPNYAQFGEHFCPFIGINTAPDWFCADGQRREK